MLLIDPQGNYPRHIGDIMLANPGWEEGQALPEGWIYVNPVEIPAHNISTQRLEELAPTLAEDGQYYQTWNVRDLTGEELEIVNAPTTARAKLKSLGLTDAEVNALFMGR
jgi:hypothetical protein